MGLAFGAVFGMAAFTPIFYAGGWWLLLTPLGVAAMLIGIAIGDRVPR